MRAAAVVEVAKAPSEAHSHQPAQRAPARRGLLPDMLCQRHAADADQPLRAARQSGGVMRSAARHAEAAGCQSRARSVSRRRGYGAFLQPEAMSARYAVTPAPAPL